MQCGRTVVAEEGVRALWKGLTPFATHLTLKYALRMGSNSVYQGLLRDEAGRLSDGRRLAAGFMAGITEALLVVTPFEVVKIRLQQQRGLAYDKLKYHVRRAMLAQPGAQQPAGRQAVPAAALLHALQRSCSRAVCACCCCVCCCVCVCVCVQNPVHCALTILREEGPRGMWSGATPTMARNGTNQMCLFWAKHNMDRWLWGKHEGDSKQLTPGQSMLSGFSAAFLGPIATGPMDVIKTRLMAQNKAAGDVQYKGLLDALVKIPTQEGPLALWRGLLPRLMRIPPGQAIVWAVSDQITGYFERQARQQQQQYGDAAPS